ncbi:MAG: CocE/NonD family hydrolase [Acidobacteriota bacterium]
MDIPNTRLLVTLFLSLAWTLPAAAQHALSPRPGDLTPPAPPHDWRMERSVFVPMRDGVRLSTDLYFPTGVDDPLPTILVRTPYSKDSWDPEQTQGLQGRAVAFFAGHGYAVIVQDTRGKYESEGSYTLNKGYRQDAYDTIAWITKQAWSNGKVGTYGCSYQGENQLYMAPSQPPGLAAMIPQHGATGIGSAGGFYGLAHDFTSGGVHLAGVLLWHHYHLSKVYYRPPPGISREEFLKIRTHFDPSPTIPEIDSDALFWTLPVVDMLDRAGGPPTDWRDFIIHQNDVTDPWWDQFDYVKDDEPIDVPSLFVESWGDFTARPALYIRQMYERTAISPQARHNQYIIISPSQHCASESLPADAQLGELALGDPRFGHFDIYLDWYDHWLKGLDNGITEMPKVQYYMIGRNEWRATNHWPPERVANRTLYFHGGGRANSHFGDGALSEAAPGEEPADRFVYDPANPVPSRGGPYSSGIGSAPYLDQRPVSIRNDVLVYTSPVLESGLEIEGPIDAVLYVSSSAKDTDFSVKLVDVAPDGKAVNVRIGFLRARYREGRHKQVFMEPGEVYRVPVSLNDIAYYFKPGHRLRVQVTSSDFPSYDRNLNTGGRNYDEREWVKAENMVHHSAEYPSHIVLPVSQRP